MRQLFLFKIEKSIVHIYQLVIDCLPEIEQEGVLLQVGDELLKDVLIGRGSSPLSEDEKI